MVSMCSRGNTYSRSHIALAPEDVEFWNFSWDEMASGDLPAIIDYVIAATGQPTIGYVGKPDDVHSAG
jgi:lysosomal acid lipase/cholesteryl ester hydrolase